MAPVTVGLSYISHVCEARDSGRLLCVTLRKSYGFEALGGARGRLSSRGDRFISTLQHCFISGGLVVVKCDKESGSLVFTLGRTFASGKTKELC